ncbi:MAG: hypothetical protein ACPH4N_03040 [Flavobacteriaceae bacterium]
MMKTKIFSILLLSLVYLSCSKKEDEENEVYSCEVDYVHFVDNTSARVNFIVSLNGVEKNYIVDQSYQKQGDTFQIGEGLVTIENFTQTGDEARFDFYYGENLGPFCMELFNAIPMHQHEAFNAEAELDLNSKNVGKWKIKRKSTLKN